MQIGIRVRSEPSLYALLYDVCKINKVCFDFMFCINGASAL